MKLAFISFLLLACFLFMSFSFWSQSDVSPTGETSIGSVADSVPDIVDSVSDVVDSTADIQTNYTFFLRQGPETGEDPDPSAKIAIQNKQFYNIPGFFWHRKIIKTNL